MKRKLALNTLVCLVFILYSSVYFIIAFSYKYLNGRYAPGAGFIPRWTSGILLGLSILGFLRSLKEDGVKISELFPRTKGTLYLFISWGALLFFVFFLKILGIVITGSITLSILFGMGMKWYKAIPISIIVSLSAFYVFRILLTIPIPVNRFGF
jgi:hypothetical protein